MSSINIRVKGRASNLAAQTKHDFDGWKPPAVKPLHVPYNQKDTIGERLILDLRSHFIC